MIGTSSCHLSYLEDYPVAYFVFFLYLFFYLVFPSLQIGPEYGVFGNNMARPASVTCLYFWACFCICLCVFHRACILYFYISYFTFLTKQAEYGKIGSSRPGLWRSLFVLVLFVFVLFVFLYFCVFLFHISYWVRCDWKQQAQRRHLPGLWGFEASTRGAGAAAGQMPATPLLSISPLPSFVMSPSIQPYEGDFVLCLPTGNIDVFFSTNACLSIEH